MLGYYGETIGPRDPELVEQAEKQAKKPPIDSRPADLLKPEWNELRAAAATLNGCNGTDEDVLTYAMFPQVATKFFATRAQGPKNLGKDPNAKPAPRCRPLRSPPGTAMPALTRAGHVRSEAEWEHA